MAETVVETILDGVPRMAERTALVAAGGAISYGTLSRLTRERAAEVQKHGSTRGSTAIVMRNDVFSVVNLLAADLVRCRALLLPPATARHDVAELSQIANAGLALDGKAQHRVEGNKLEVEEGDEFICQLTSGTSGPSRLAARTRKGVLEEIEQVRDRLGMTAQDRMMCVSSVAHSYALVGGLLGSLASGAEVILASSSGARAVRGAPTIIFGLPSTYARILEEDDADAPEGLRFVRLAFSAGAPLSPRVFEGFREQYGIAIRQDYGTTETGTISLDTRREADPQSVGQPLGHVGVRLGDVQAVGEQRVSVREIQVRGEAVAKRYLTSNGPVTAAGPDGWYRTGDEGRLEGGNLYVGPRIRPLLRLRGRSVAPEVLEAGLERLPGVSEAVALAQGDSWKAVVAGRGLSREKIRDFCRDELGHEPIDIDVRDAIPRSPAGKILHKDLV